MSIFSLIGIVALVSALLSGWGVQRMTALHYQHLIEQQAAEQREAIDKANVNAQAAAELYEEAKAKTRIKVVTVTKEVSRAIETEPVWGGTAVPASVRSAIAAAGSALAAPEPDGAVQLPLAGRADERAVGPGLHLGARSLGGLFGTAPRAGDGG